MTRHGLNAEQYCDRLEKIMARCGVDRLLARSGVVVFYSGPSTVVRFAVGPDPESNAERSRQMADQLGGSRIDDTRLGKILWNRRLYDHFRNVYAAEPDPDKAANDAFLKVWGCVSAYFARSEFRQAATAVCGADPGRVFLRYELASLVDNTHVETINAIDMRAVREMYRLVGADEGFDLICRSELLMIHQTIESADPSRKGTIEQDFRERLSFYEVERRETAESRTAMGSLPLTDEQELRKQEIVRKYNLETVYDNPSTWDSPPIMPSPSAPRSGGLAPALR